MWLTSLLYRPKPVWRRIPQQQSFLPRLEILEDRTLPSTLTVLNNLDKGAGSLRDTITNAKSGDMIVFSPSLNGQTITLTSDQLTLNKSLDIEGPGARLLAISGNDTNRVFNINAGLTATIAGLTITHGRGGGEKSTDITGAGGGGILNAGSTLAVANDILSYNQADGHGGGIANLPRGVLTVTNSTFLGNQAIGKDKQALTEGGAIWNSAGTTPGTSATVIASTFIDNRAIGGSGGTLTGSGNLLGEANGGAIHNDGTSTLAVIDSTFIGNQAVAGSGASGGKVAGGYTVDVGDGGAIANDDSLATLVVSGSTFSYNQAVGGSNASGSSGGGVGRIGNGAGGAIKNGGMATITNSTFDHNQAPGGSNNSGGSGLSIVGRGAGGAIANNSSAASLVAEHLTFIANVASGGAGNTGDPFAGDGAGGGSSISSGPALPLAIARSPATWRWAAPAAMVATGWAAVWQTSWGPLSALSAAH
jgi:hypothetical protein